MFPRRVFTLPPLLHKGGLITLRKPAFTAALSDDLMTAREFQRTMRIVAVIREYPTDKLSSFVDMLEIEIDALESGFFTKDNFERLPPFTIVAGVAAAGIWSAFSAHFLGVNVLNRWGQWALNAINNILGDHSSTLMSVFFAIGMILIVSVSLGRYQTLDQVHKLKRLKRVIKLYRKSGNVEAMVAA